MKKRMIGLLIVLCMVITMLPVFSVKVDAASPQGSDYTSSTWLANKLDSIFAGNASIYSNSGCTSLVNTKLGSQSVPNNGVNKYVGPYGGPALNTGTSCWIYANGVYYTLWGEVTGNGTPGSHSVSLNVNNGSLTYDNFRAWGVRNAPGALIRSVSGHSMILLGYNSNSYTILAGNDDFPETGLVRIRVIPWSESKYQASYIIQPTDSYFSAMTGDGNTGSDPIICLDIVESPGVGKIHVRGWAFDPDNTNGAVPVHFYTGADTFLGAVDANTCRSDVDIKYHCGEYHGFDTVLTTGLSGTFNVRAAAINAYGSGSTKWSGEKSVTVAADTEKPEISNVRISERSSTGYTLTCTVTDNVGINSVVFPTWSEPDGQDDVVWHKGTVSGNTATCRINTSDHKDNINCIYLTDIYVGDYAGNTTTFLTSFRVDAMPPVISDIKIENVSDDGYDIVCNVADEDDAGLGRVLFPTWTNKDDQDDLQQPWTENPLYRGTIEGNTVRYRVNTSDHNGEKGYYTTHIYASDASGNSDWLEVDAYIGDISERSEHIYQTGSFNGSQYIVFTNESFWSAASTYCQSLGGHLAAISSKAENDYVLSLLEPGAGPYWIGANDMAQEGEFVWANGEAFEYTNWRNGEPNNLGGQQDCGLITSDGTWDDENVNTTHPFVMEIENPEPVTNPFSDVPDGKFFTDAVLWAVSHDPQITNGYADGTFRPDQTCTRAQVVTFLWRANGCPEPETTANPFSDVKASDYYYKAVLWALENGITTGKTQTTFDPNCECTRAHVVTFLWRSEGSPEPASAANPFTDVPAGKYYAKAVLWALENGITTGKTPSTFDPDGACTRGHVVTFLYRDLA